MLNKIAALILAAFSVLAGCVGTADQLLMVKGDVQLEGVRVEDCVMRVVNGQERVLYEDRMTKTGQAGFPNPPPSGQFFVDVICGSRTARNGPYLFERDYKIDLGKVTPR